ncbi:TPA: hypothetical protein ACGY62_001448 [Enterococcus faecalis]|uniref:hypothetical protein n=1 Tax=Enterococcus TaxID=1350 RepID=UPI0003547D99|nr:hypothetical protein [Enterococcus faecalis]EPH74754.1 hypothetical protein D929_01096 [Enterococcus faecalis 02-MB-P-10]WBY27543.1 hypothetical protein PE069_05710 [Enterococcus faecalis]WHT29901.1 hypothetical protein OGM83_03610 [Enterococcus faecalis]VFU86419.1 hypothetical protein B02_01390 [Enterococcus faecalis]VFU87265.1 hypothetical protein B01_01408 [Enterococcus faecalis]
MKSKGTQVTARDQSIAICGDKNSINQFLTITREPKRAFVFDVCKIIVEKNFEENAEYSISSNANWSKKIEYNQIDKYELIFDEYSFAREDIEELLEGYENRTKLIRNFKTLYIDSTYKFPNENNDYRLDWVFKSLCNIVDESSEPTDALYTEDRNQAIYQLMFYAFTKCQILEKPPKKG